MKLTILDAGINIQRRPRERLHLWPVQYLSTAGRDFDGECGHNVLRGSRFAGSAGRGKSRPWNPSSIFTKITDLA
jgi:hypothetical protein